MSEQEFIPRIAMSIHAHPDDQEFTVAGTLARWAAAGCEVVSVVITSGDAGSNDADKDPGTFKPELAARREQEQLAANAVLGIRQTVFLRHADGELEPTLALRRELTRLIRRHRPDAVVIGDPQGVFYGNGYINHPDHRAAAQAALYAVFPSAETRLIFTDLLAEGLAPHKVRRVYVHGTEKPDTWVDIAGTLPLKIEALRRHASQLGDWDPEQMIREWAAEEAAGHELAFAEAYKVMVMHADTPEN